MSELLIVGPSVDELGGELPGGHGQSGFVTALTFAEDDETNVIGEQPIQNRHENGKTLLFDDAGNHSKHRTAWGEGQAQSTNQCVPTKVLSGNIFDIISGRQMRIIRRVA